MTKGLGSTWVSIQMSPTEKEILDNAVAEAQKENVRLTRNRFLRDFIATLKPKT